MLQEFKKFILRGNLIDLAIGFTVGASFSTVAKSLVEDILMPPIAALLGQTDFSNTFLILKKGSENPGPYNTLAEANTAGAITLNYGNFINNLLALLVVAFAMFLVVKGVNYLEDHLEVIGKKTSDKKDAPSHKKCPFCLQAIPYLATRCQFCTSKLEAKK